MSQAIVEPEASGAATTNAQNQLVQAAIKEVSHIATLPEVTMKIIGLVEDPDSTAQDLNKVISNDPALGARILKVVNSAFYGLPRQIGSINRAIVLLGLNAVKNIAIAARPAAAPPTKRWARAGSMMATNVPSTKKPSRQAVIRERSS